MSERSVNNNNAATSPSNLFVVDVAAITDRGLSDKRPVNEDSFLSDTERRIFAVADGVGGAQSGEVASQTAIETLDEAFRHHKDGEDAEDLMEIAFQRANVAIHQMSREHHRLAMMATTIVAIHFDGAHAIIGHVGDSRLYSLTPDGELRRETVDHSVVEEEIRAGRLTPDEAQHHPNRNVISRALGAEPSVEAEMQSIEIAANTTLLLCSDGITRHIPDVELRELLASEPDIHRICEELKKRCFERGAEDNLTAVVIRLRAQGESHAFATKPLDPEQTIAYERPRAAYATGDLPRAFADFGVAKPTEATASEQVGSQTTHSLRPFATTRLEVPMTAPATTIEQESPPNDAQSISHNTGDEKTNTAAVSKPSRSKFLIPLALMFLIACAVAVVFYGNRINIPRSEIVTLPAIEQNTVSTPAPLPTPMQPNDTTVNNSFTYVERRTAVDEAPQIMMRKMWQERSGAPLDDTDPQFLYLYGRALLGSGRDREALEAFRRTIKVVRQSEPLTNTAESGMLDRIEVELRSTDAISLRRASVMIDEIMAAKSVQRAAHFKRHKYVTG